MRSKEKTSKENIEKKKCRYSTDRGVTFSFLQYYSL